MSSRINRQYKERDVYIRVDVLVARMFVKGEATNYIIKTLFICFTTDEKG